jgi:FMN-dependent NADH-azoreductase
MNILNIVTSPRKEKSASTAIVNAFLSEYRAHVGNVTVDTLDIWQEHLPEFDAEAISAQAAIPLILRFSREEICSAVGLALPNLVGNLWIP